MIRLFVGLALPDLLKQRLAILSGGLPNSRWTPAENLHLTLRFIGDINEITADDIDENLRGIRVAAFPLEIGSLGTFNAGRRAYSLWVGVQRSSSLMLLQEKIERAVVRAGCQPERRRFQPHVTLAKLKDPPLERLQGYIAGHNLFRTSLDVSSFTLFSSHLGHGDPIYRAECDYPLVEG
ncbi:MAG TPA: RNA 2',3'-cyclic phosphodiesterase [Telmatospirillum sp.]|nr:RNA 2',3'-cyclic phosphodiesterase [Telmatospirillum sp.]